MNEMKTRRFKRYTIYTTRTVRGYRVTRRELSTIMWPLIWKKN